MRYGNYQRMTSSILDLTYNSERRDSALCRSLAFLPSIAAFVSSLLVTSPVLFADGLHIEAREVAQHQDDSIALTGLEYRFPIIEVVLQNNSKQNDLHIDGFRFRLTSHPIDRSPRLVFSLFDCLGESFVKVRNVGWGPYLGGSLDVLSPHDSAVSFDYVSERGVAARFGDLLDMKQPRIRIPKILSGDFGLVALPIGRDAVPYVLQRMGTFRIDPIDDQAFVVGTRFEDFPDQSTTAPPWRVNNLKHLSYTKAVTTFSGTGAFEGYLRTNGSVPSRVVYLGESLHTAPQSIKVIPSSFRLAPLTWYGGFASRWWMGFGNELDTSSPAGPSGEVFGVAVDYGFFEKEAYYCSCDLTVKKAKSITIRVQSIASASATIGVTMDFRGKFGSAGIDLRPGRLEPKRMITAQNSRGDDYRELITFPVQRIVRPRPISFDIKDTLETLRAIERLKRDIPGQVTLVKNAERVIAQGLPSPQEPWNSAADLVSRTKHFADAALVLRYLGGAPLTQKDAEAIASGLIQYGESYPLSATQPMSFLQEPPKPIPDVESGGSLPVTPLQELQGEASNTENQKDEVLVNANRHYGRVLQDYLVPHLAIQFPQLTVDSALAILRKGDVPFWLDDAIDVATVRLKLAAELKRETKLRESMPLRQRFILQATVKAPFVEWSDGDLQSLSDRLLVWGVKQTGDSRLRDYILKAYQESKSSVSVDADPHFQILREIRDQRCEDLIAVVIAQLERFGCEESEQRSTIAALQFVRDTKRYTEARNVLEELAARCPLGLVRMRAQEAYSEMSGKK
jgi:hypothetical protein